MIGSKFQTWRPSGWRCAVSSRELPSDGRWVLTLLDAFGGELINPDAMPSGDGSQSEVDSERTLLRPAANAGDFKTLLNLRLFSPYVGFPVWFIISRDIRIRTAVNLGFERRRWSSNSKVDGHPNIWTTAILRFERWWILDLNNSSDSHIRVAANVSFEQTRLTKNRSA